MHTYVIILHFTVFIVNVLPRHYILQIINFLFLSRVLNVYFLMTFSVSRDRIEILENSRAIGTTLGFFAHYLNLLLTTIP